MVGERLKSIKCFRRHTNDHGLLGFRRRHLARAGAAQKWYAGVGRERHRGNGRGNWKTRSGQEGSVDLMNRSLPATYDKESLLCVRWKIYSLVLAGAVVPVVVQRYNLLSTARRWK